MFSWFVLYEANHAFHPVLSFRGVQRIYRFVTTFPIPTIPFHLYLFMKSW